MMTAPHAIFLDFDGTLGHHGIVPKVHVDAVKRVRAAGHFAFLCTGRPLCMVPSSVLEMLDGVVGAAGAFVQVGEKILRDDRFPQELAERTQEVLSASKAPFVLEAPEGMYGNADTREYLDLLLAAFDISPGQLPPGAIGGGKSDILECFTLRENLAGTSFAKAVIWQSATPISDFAAQIDPQIRPMPNSIDDNGTNSGELQLQSIDKIHGVKIVAEHLGIPLSRTVACGDGLNDVDMLRGAGIAVVIDGSAAAREVPAARISVPGPLEGGLDIAFSQLNLYS